MTDPVGNVRSVPIEEELKTAYLDYAMSVIVSRALPDVRDGLKPVHRRILYTMNEMGLNSGASYRKCAAIVGDVMGKYHPHGDQAIYDALVRLAQDFSLRFPLVDGQGNFGSVDGDPAAAMRYTEARMTAITAEILADIDKDTVEFVENYDGTRMQPSVLPAKLPNLLINGSAGIAVGMATNIPPHNLGEVVRATQALIDDPEMNTDALCEHLLGPDLPTGATIFRYDRRRNPVTGEWEEIDAIRDMYRHGRGRVVMQAQVAFEETRAGRTAIVATSIPYQVNKSTLLEKIADLVKSGKVDGIADMRDESDRDGMRIVIECKRDAAPRKVLNNLFKHTALKMAFNANMVALVDGQPQTLSLKQMLQHHIEWRQEVVRRRTEFDLQKAKDRAHILEGLKTALDNLDAVIRTIRESADVETARRNLMERFGLSEVQANAILEMQLRRLAALERQKIEDEYVSIIQKIAELEDILANPKRVLQIIRDELGELRPQVRTGPPHPHRGQRGQGAQRRRPHRRRGRGHHHQRPRLHQAPAAGHLPAPGARRQGHHRRPHRRGGRGRAPARGQHPRLGPVLHRSRPCLQLQGAPDPRCHAARPRACPSSTSRACRWTPASACWRSSPCPTSSPATTWSWPRSRVSSRRPPSRSSSACAPRASVPSPWPKTTSSRG